MTNVLSDFHRGRFLCNILMLLCLLVSFFYTLRGRLLLSIQVFTACAFILFTTSVVINGGVMVPNYVGFFVIIVLTSVFSTPKVMFSVYGFSTLLGALSLTWLETTPAPELYPSPFRYWTIYTIFGLVLTSVLYLNRSVFNRVLLKLADREALVSSTFVSISEPLLVFDDQQRLVQMNPSAAMLDSQMKQECGLQLLEIPCLNLNTHEQKTFFEQLDLISPDHKTLSLHILLGMRQRWLSVTSSPRLLHGELVGSVIFIRDVTDQHYLVQAQKMSAVGSLASGIAHDFNNMLGAIANATSVLTAELSAEHHEALDVLQEATKRSSELTSQLLIFSRKKPHKVVPIDAHSLLHNIVDLLQRAAAKDIQISLDLSASQFIVSGNEGQLHSALMNLGLNGIQAMPGGGQLSFSSELITLDAQDCSLLPFQLVPGLFLMIKVQDSGVGIPPEVQNRIFEPFFTTKEIGQGTGLGLTMVYRMLESHKGAIDVNSSEGKGTCFRLYLPIDTATPRPEAPPPMLPVHTGLRILIIDDEPLVRRALSRMLRLLGHIPTSTDSGEAAMAILNRGEPFELVILDMLMPQKNGDEVFYEIKALRSELPVIISSGFTHEGILTELKKNNLSGVLLKPYSPTELNQCISHALTM
ncbi:MAG: ATP-binding protein [Myxococcota bacterium]|nr:ATP-binding protein [Myxococcota bacterium]